jgi:hypothetical protein
MSKLFSGGLGALLLCICSVAFGGCGGSSEPQQSDLESVVADAMEGSPYEYRILPALTTDKYLVFNVFSPAQAIGINVAFGLPTKRNTCPEPPQLPVPHRDTSRGFTGAAAHPLICMADDSWRVSDSQRESEVRGRMGDYSLATALCEEVYDKEPYEDFVCFD